MAGSRIRNKVDDFARSLSRLSARERMALAALGGTVFLVVAAAVGYVILSGLDELEERNEAMRKALSDLQRFGPAYRLNRQRMAALEGRLSSTPVDLNTLVEKAAKEVGVHIAESDMMQPVEVGRYTQQGLQVKLGKVKIDQLAKFMKVLEENTYLVQITRLSVNTNWTNHEVMDVEMVVSTYVKKKKDKAGRDKGKERS